MNLAPTFRRPKSPPKVLGDHHRWPGAKWSRWLCYQAAHAHVRAFDDCAGAAGLDIEPSQEPIFTQ